MPRFFLRRGRILPGPLKILQPAERRRPVPVKGLALTSAAMAAGLLLLPLLSPQVSVDPTPMVTFAESSGSETVPGAEAAGFAEAAPVEPAVTSSSPPPARLASAEPVRAASEPATTHPAAPAPAKPALDPSLFQVDLLPVLQADGADLDSAPAPVVGPQRFAKATSRRAATSNRGTAFVATGGPAQP